VTSETWVVKRKENYIIFFSINSSLLLLSTSHKKTSRRTRVWRACSNLGWIWILCGWIWKIVESKDNGHIMAGVGSRVSSIKCRLLDFTTIRELLPQTQHYAIIYPSVNYIFFHLYTPIFFRSSSTKLIQSYFPRSCKVSFPEVSILALIWRYHPNPFSLCVQICLIIVFVYTPTISYNSLLYLLH